MVNLQKIVAVYLFITEKKKWRKVVNTIVLQYMFLSSKPWFSSSGMCGHTRQPSHWQVRIQSESDSWDRGKWLPEMKDEGTLTEKLFEWLVFLQS